MGLYEYLPALSALSRQMSELAAQPIQEEPPDHAPPRVLLARAMADFLAQLPVYDVCLTPDTPFMRHFVDFLCGTHDDETDEEQLFEDLVLFFREKTLRLAPHRMSEVEREVLKHFEDAQRPDDLDNLARRWYWVCLPALVQKEFSEACGFCHPAGEEFYQLLMGF